MSSPSPNDLQRWLRKPEQTAIKPSTELPVPKAEKQGSADEKQGRTRKAENNGVQPTEKLSVSQKVKSWVQRGARLYGYLLAGLAPFAALKPIVKHFHQLDSVSWFNILVNLFHAFGIATLFFFFAYVLCGMTFCAIAIYGIAAVVYFRTKLPTDWALIEKEVKEVDRVGKKYINYCSFPPALLMTVIWKRHLFGASNLIAHPNYGFMGWGITVVSGAVISVTYFAVAMQIKKWWMEEKVSTPE